MKKKDKSLGDAVVVGSALAGAALGAAAVMLSDKKNQEKIKKTVDGISQEAVALGKNIKKKATDLARKRKKTARKPVRKIKVRKKVTKKSPSVKSSSTVN